MDTDTQQRRHGGRSLLTTVIRQERGPILGAAALLTGWSVGEALVPAVIGATVDEAVGPSDLSALVLWLVVLAACFAMLSFGFMWGSRVGTYAMNRQKHLLRCRVTAAALAPARTGDAQHPQRPAGEVAALSAADSDNASSVIMQIAMGGSAVLGLLVSAGYLLWADLWVGVAVVLVSPLSLFALRWLMPRLSATTHSQQSGIAAAGASAADILRGVEVLRGIGGESTAAGWYARRSRAAATAGVDSAAASGRVEGAQVLLTGVVLLVAAVFSAVRVVDGAMTVGTMVGVLGVTSFLATPLGIIVHVVESYTRSSASAARIADFTDGVDAPVAHRDGGSGETAGGGDADRTLTVLPRDGEPLHCAPGALTAVVCASPQARRGVLDALGSAGGGRLFLDGQDVAGVDPAVLPGVLRVSPHEAHLFRGTVRSNITGSDGDTVSQDVLRASGVDELVDLFADGLDHRVDGEGANLSGGQRQRIALARALHGGALARVLVDPTTAVDSVTEARIADGLRELRGGGDQGTAVVVTTAPSLLAVADTVVFVREGSVSVAGHRELCADADYREVVTR
ncbi:MAG: ABC transporter transmembrane domain-containing protein [Corynebacterium sp.]|uniref:ABC transporter transmembrane domain-containing protein n=1 Tax=Corynebacterium TaxID=1716 RepID=UPI003F93E804